MGGGASREERAEGSAVTGKYNCKLIMPPNVAGQQLAGGPFPGGRLKRQAVPRRLMTLNKQKHTTALYAHLMNTVAEEAGGRSLFGWNVRKMNEIVARFQPLFNDKGVGVSFSMVWWYVSRGEYSHTEYRYWFEFMDAGVVATAAEFVPVLEDSIGNFDCVANLATVEATAVTQEDAVPLPVQGIWRLDAPRLEGDATRVLRATITVTRRGDVLHVALDCWRKLRIFRFHSRWNIAGTAIVSGENVYHLRHLGSTFILTLTSPKTLMLTAPKISDPICFVKYNAR